MWGAEGTKILDEYVRGVCSRIEFMLLIYEGLVDVRLYPVESSSIKRNRSDD